MSGEPAWESIRRRFLATGEASAVLAGRSELTDRLAAAAWHGFLAPAWPRGMALLAVGGYGRRELFPYSDVDLLFLVERPPDGPRKEALSEFLRTMWDSGVRLSHSVHSPKECLEINHHNIELSVSLLDQRFLCGDRDLYQRLIDRLPRFLQSQRPALIRRLGQLVRARHAKYQNTVCHLEPNVKETPGGLRDLHVLWWLNKLRQDPIVASEWLDGLHPARSFLARVRCFLHYRAGRDDNILSFEAQEEFADLPFAPSADPGECMREYFLHARAVHRSTLRAMDASEGAHSSLLKSFRDWRSRLSNIEFTVSRERVFLRSPAAIAYDPELVIRLFQFVARHGLRLALETERRIADYLPAIETYFAGQKAHWVALFDLLALPHASLALTAMHETGVLQAVFPEWRRLDCLVIRDFYHRYTVDEHSLLAIRCLEDLARTSDPARRLFADLLSEIDEPAALRFALLFHDAGKGHGESPHTQRSVALAEQAMERIQLPLQKRSLIRFLIEQHLELSAAMTSRDLDDPAVARMLADTVGTLEHLKCLTLLTYADVCAVNPTAMSPWRLEQLWRTYLVAYNQLTRELETDRIHPAPGDSPELAAFLEGLPVRYLRTHSRQEIEAHLELERQSRAAGVALAIERRNGIYHLTIVAKDRPYLLASLAGALAGFGLNILKAEAFANAQGTILDTFSFEDPNRNLELNPSEIERLTLTLQRVTLGKLKVGQLLKTRPAPPPPTQRSRIEPAVSFNHSASETATLIEIVAEDRPGLLHDLTRAISEAGCNIEVVLVDTEAHKAIDVFYVTLNGRKLTPVESDPLGKALLAAARPS